VIGIEVEVLTSWWDDSRQFCSQYRIGGGKIRRFFVNKGEYWGWGRYSSSWIAGG
jgi:hypothetical protein